MNQYMLLFNGLLTKMDLSMHFSLTNTLQMKGNVL